MKILFLNQYFPPDASASAYLLGELAEDLAKHHEVTVLAGRPSYNPETSTFQPRNVAVRRAPSTTFQRSTLLGRTLNYLSFLVTSIIIAARLSRPDVVVSLTDPPILGIIGAGVARWHRCPFVYVCQDIFPDVAIALGKIRNRPLQILWRLLNRVVRKAAARVVVIGRDMQRKLEREGTPIDKLIHLPNWAEAFHPDRPQIQTLRTELGWASSYIVMHAGNVGLAQNLMTFIHAAQILRNEFSIKFVLVGDGAARIELVAEVNRLRLSNVEFLPYRPKSEAQTLVAAADLHVISLAPGLTGCAVPSKVYGILAAARPFVAAVEDESEIGLLLEEFSCGVRVEPDDSQSLAKAILNMRSDRSADYARRGVELFKARFQRPIVTEQYRTMLESLVASSGEACSGISCP